MAERNNMASIDLQKLKAHRQRTFHLDSAIRLSTPAQALDFVNERGFVYFWPIKGITLPSLWVATAGDRPVPDNHDDPGNITWDWKDKSLGQKIWYYGKILRRKATFISCFPIQTCTNQAAIIFSKGVSLFSARNTPSLQCLPDKHNYGRILV